MFKIEQAPEYLSHGKFQYCNICFCQESRWKFSITVVLFAYGGKKKSFKNVSFRNVEMLLWISLQLWEWYPHPKCTLCQGGSCFLKWVLFTLLSGSWPQSFSFSACSPSFHALQWLRDGQGVGGVRTAFCWWVGKEGWMQWEEQSKGWKQSTPQRCQGKKSTGPHHSYSFHFSLPNRRQ